MSFNLCNQNNQNSNDRACIQVKRVFDAGIKQFTLENEVVKLDESVDNVTFVSGKSSGSATLEDVVVEHIKGCGNQARIQANVVVPIELTYLTSDNVEATVKSSIVLPQDVVLCLPESSIVPYEIDVVAGCVIPEGTFKTDSVAVVSACITIILKVVTEVDLIVQSCGYCKIPEMQEYAQEICQDFFELPLFPNSPCCKGNRK